MQWSTSSIGRYEPNGTITSYHLHRIGPFNSAENGLFFPAREWPLLPDPNSFIISCATSAIFILVANRYVTDVMNNTALDSYFHTQCILIQIPVLFIGVILYYLNNGKNQLAIFVAVTVSAFELFILFHLNKRVLSSTLIAGMLFGCLFLFMRMYMKNISGAIGFIGKYSFCIYLFHLIVIKSFGKLLNQRWVLSLGLYY